MDPVIYKVSEFTREARALLEDNFTGIWLTGEISNLATPASGHVYFSLKDDKAQLRCAMFRNRRTRHTAAPSTRSGVLFLSMNLGVIFS